MLLGHRQFQYEFDGMDSRGLIFKKMVVQSLGKDESWTLEKGSIPGTVAPLRAWQSLHRRQPSDSLVLTPKAVANK